MHPNGIRTLEAARPTTPPQQALLAALRLSGAVLFPWRPGKHGWQVRIGLHANATNGFSLMLESSRFGWTNRDHDSRMSKLRTQLRELGFPLSSEMADGRNVLVVGLQAAAALFGHLRRR